MDTKSIGLLIGGLLPAVCFAGSNLFAKSSTSAGISTGMYLLFVGLAVVLVAGIVLLLEPSSSIGTRSGVFAMCSGAVWAIGAGGVAIALSQFGVPVSKLVPLFNTNTLLSVVLGLWIYSEWQEADVKTLSLGALLIFVGSVLVTKS